MLWAWQIPFLWGTLCDIWKIHTLKNAENVEKERNMKDKDKL